VPEKTKRGACTCFEQQQGIAIWFCQSVNSAKQTFRLAPNADPGGSGRVAAIQGSGGGVSNDAAPVR
jgi:hypothetical protein